MFKGALVIVIIAAVLFYALSYTNMSSLPERLPGTDIPAPTLVAISDFSQTLSSPMDGGASFMPLKP